MNQRPNSEGAKRQGPLFVVGMWPSGTSALYALLNQHPQIPLLFEGDLRLLSSRFVTPQNPAKLLARWNFWNGAARRHRIGLDQLPNRICSVREAMDATYSEYAAQKDASIGGEKSPNYYDRLDHLASEFPEARFLIIWRNPMNVCASILSARDACSWFARKGMLLRGLLGFKRLKQQCDELVRQGHRVHQINYEDLVGDTETVMRRICRFLDVPFDPRMTSLDGADVSAIYAEEHHSGVRRESIHLKPERTYLIPPEIRRKVKRYICEWKEAYAGVWPAYPFLITGNVAKPGKIEQVLDEIAYRALRVYDRSVHMLYGIAPLPLLGTYRSLKEWYHKTKSEKFPSSSEWLRGSWTNTVPPRAVGARSGFTMMSSKNLPSQRPSRMHGSGD